MPSLTSSNICRKLIGAIDDTRFFPLPELFRNSAKTLQSQNVHIALLSEAGGGVMRHLLDLHRGLLSRGWNSTLIVSSKRMDERYLDEVHALDPDHLAFVDMERAPHGSDLSAYLQVKAILASMRGPRVLHAHSTKAGLLGTLLHSEAEAMTYTPHAYRATDPSLSPVKRNLLRTVEMAYSRPYDQIIAVSKSERDYALACGVDPERVVYVPNGIDCNEANLITMRRRRWHLPKKVTLGFLGRLAHQKDPLLFIETLAYLKNLGHDVDAIVVGEGALRQPMMALAEQLGVASRILWKGEIAAHESLGDMDIMVHTSRYEALPYTLLEACASLLPIVSTENHGSRSVLQGKLADNIVSEATAEKLGTRILQLLQDESLWQSQFDLLEAAAHAFSLDMMVNATERVYTGLLSRQPKVSRHMERYLLPTVSRIAPLA